MNILFQNFPDTVDVNGREYPVVTDFREWIKLHEFLKEVDTFTPEILRMILDWYVDEVPRDIEAAILALEEFLAAEELQDYKSSEEEEERPGAPVFSFSQDAVFIYSAFREVYGIDLENIEYMHWWKFKTLFDGLPSDTEIKERIYYRGVNLNAIKDKEERKRIQKIQRRIAIRDERKKVVSDYDIGDAFA